MSIRASDPPPLTEVGFGRPLRPRIGAALLARLAIEITLTQPALDLAFLPHATAMDEIAAGAAAGIDHSRMRDLRAADARSQGERDNDRNATDTQASKGRFSFALHGRLPLSG